MKKIAFYLCGFLAVVASMMAMTACSNDLEPEIAYNEGLVDFTMSTSLPSELTTYATVGTSSAQGGIINLMDKDGYYVRYIMEVYPETSDVMSLRMIKYKELTSSDDVRNITFESRLLAAKYRFVFYADIVRKVTLTGGTPEGLDANCYGNQYFLSNTDESSDVLFRPVYLDDAQEGNLQNIQPTSQAYLLPYGHTSLEQYDVYTCKGNVDLRTENSSSFTLKRPFAKVRIVTTDADDEQLPSDMNWDLTEVSLSSSDSENKLNNTYNALTETSSQNGSSYYNATYKTSPKGTDTYTEEENSEERTLGVFYIPVSNVSSNLNLKIWAYAGGTEVLSDIPITVENVPLAANKLTTIKGKLLTKKFVSEIRIDDEFEGEEVVEYGLEAATVDNLKTYLENGSTIIAYTGSVSKEDGFTLDFDELEGVVTYSSDNPLYPEGNEASITLEFTNVEKDAIITLKGENTPKTVKIITSTKCSLVLNMPNSDTYYDGAEYKYIATNTGAIGWKSGVQYDVMFGAGNGDRFYPASYTNSHMFKINEDFTLPSSLKCIFVSKHEDKTCDFLTELNTWLENNSSSPIWEFIEENK